ncbi:MULTISPECIES: hypothetical protein [unclassified Pseudoclavibacter]|uniref:hypothetical protein n=1 Tax=unclassified Pseudoclavibacter TaxID=2615177 RepID=UPI001BABF9D3|nr:hypothetical protein [Pseudoclavibacter sp. Marseille-Q4354]MBS3179408.1 hypothetical protein [Pseudoclavibacter sp. Marseille-Q4354]
MTEEPQNDERVEPVEPADDYDPMIYDAMREAANRLGGLYMERWHQARDEAGKAKWLALNDQVWRESREVDPASLEDVQRARADFVARFTAEGH